MGKRRAARALAVLGAAAGILGLGGATLVRHTPSSPALGLALEAAWFASFLALLAVGLAMLSPTGLSVRLGLGRGRLPSATLALAVLGTLGLSFALNLVIERLGLDEGGTLGLLESSLRGARGFALAGALAGIGIAPAISEELLFRGLLQRGLVWRLGAPLAVGIAAFAFACVHLDPVQGSAALLLGLYLGCIAHFADSVRASALCHAANNLTAVLSAALWPDTPPPPAAFAGLGLVAAATALVAARRAGRASARREARARAEREAPLVSPAVEGHGQPVAEAQEDTHQASPDQQ